MGDRAFALSSVIFVGIVLLAAGIIATIAFSYNRNTVDQCLTLGDALSVVDSKYSCYDTVGGQSALSLLFKRQVEGVQVTFIDPEGRRQVKIVKGASSQDVRGLNGAYNEPVSYSSDTIETFVYGGGAASSVEVAPVVNGQVCGVSDSRVLQPCSPEAVSSLALGEETGQSTVSGNNTHLECVSNTCTVVSGAGTDTCTTVGTFCGSRGGGGGGGGGGSSGPSGGGSPGNQVPIAYFTTNVTSGAVPLSVLFNATLSTDPDGSIVSYSWNFGDGNITIASIPIITHMYSIEGLYDVFLIVNDNGGATDDANITIDASSAASTSLCPNGVIDIPNGETCDDNNSIIGDGCSDTCQLELFSVAITSPSQGASLNYNTSVLLNYTVTDSSSTLQACWYSLDGLANVSLPGCGTKLLNISEGSHAITVYASTSSARVTSSQVSFVVNLNAPAITLLSPGDGQDINSQPIVFSYVPTDSSLQNCSLWGNFSGAYGVVQTSTSLISGATNNFSLAVSEGNYLWAVSCYDSFNFGTITSNRTLTVDRTAPLFAGLSNAPINNSAYSFLGSYSFNATVSGNPQAVIVQVDSKSSTATLLSSGLYGIISPSLSAGIHTIQWTANDSAGNSNQTSQTYFVAKAVPTGDISLSGQNVVYPTFVTAFTIDSNSGDADVSYLLYRNASLISSGDSTLLGSGSYLYQLNSTAGTNYSASSISAKTVVVSQAASSATLSFLPGSSPQPFGTSLTASCSDTNSEAASKLYRNGLDVTGQNGVGVVLGAGSYTFICNVTSTQNYSSASQSSVYQISQATGDVLGFVNNTQSNIGIRVGSVIPLNASLASGTGQIQLELNGAVVAQGVSPLSVSQSFASAGVNNITARYIGNNNYTSDAETWFVTVSANQIPVALFNATPQTGNAPLTVFFNATNSYDSDGSIVSYSWDFGDLQLGSGQTVSHLYSSGIPATYVVILTVTDNNGATNTTSLSITTTSSSDTTQPTVGSLSAAPTSPQTFNPVKMYTFNATCTDNVAVSSVILMLNGANYTATKVGATNVYTKSFTTLGSDGGSGYTWVFWCNDTSGNSKLSNPTIAYTVNQNTSTCVINSNGPVTYPTALTITGSCSSTDIVAKLYKNGTGDISSKNGVATVWGVGNYNFTVNVTQTQNYTRAGQSVIASVLRGSASLSLSGVPGSTVTQGTQTTVTGTGCPSELNCVLTRNGTVVSNPDIQTLGVGTYSYNYSTVGNLNYSASSNNFTLLINAPSIVCGNGLIESGEVCDDSNTNNGDGCSDTCQVESGYSCNGQPSICSQTSPVSSSCPVGYCLPRDDLGWTNYTPSADSKFVYVSNAGNDNTCQAYTLAQVGDPYNPSSVTPCASIAVATSKLRTGFPDWMLLKRGDSWNTPLGTWSGLYYQWLLSGRSYDEPMVVTSYGSSTKRPLLRTPANQNGINIDSGAKNYLAFNGLDFIASNRTGVDYFTDGFVNVPGGNNIIIEDCKFQNYIHGISIAGTSVNFTLRRSQILDSWEADFGHAQGMIAGATRGQLYQENVIDYGGWIDDFPTHDLLFLPNSTLSQWTAVTNGKFNITFWNITNPDWQTNVLYYSVSGIDFSTATSLSDVASKIQNAVNAKVGFNILNVSVFYLNRTGKNYFVFNPYNATTNQPVGLSVSTYTGPVSGGTDISGSVQYGQLLGYLNGPGGYAHGDVYRQGTYIARSAGNRNIYFLDNIIARSSHAGIAFGDSGVAKGNLLLRNPVPVTTTSTGNTIENNVILESSDVVPPTFIGDLRAQPRGYGIETNEGQFDPLTGQYYSGPLIYRNNLIASPIGTGNTVGILLRKSINAPATNLTLEGNIIYGWSTPVGGFGSYQGEGTHLDVQHGNPWNDTVTIRDNIFQEPVNHGPSSALINFVPTTVDTNHFTFSNNTYYMTGSSNWFTVGYVAKNFSQWVALSGESNAVNQQVNFVDPTRSVSGYSASLGKPATFDAFMDQVRNQSRYNWRTEYTAPIVNQYIRDGFQIGGGRPGDCGDVGCSPTSSELNLFQKLWKTIFTGNKLSGNIVVFENLTYSSRGWSNLVGHVVAPFSSNGQITLASLVSMVLLLVLIIVATIVLIVRRFK